MKRLVALISNSSGDRKQQADQHRALVLLEIIGIKPEKVNGDDPGQMVRRDKLFEVSRTRNQYPQFFLVDDDDDDNDNDNDNEGGEATTTTFVGRFEDIQALADNNELTKEALGLPAEDPDYKETPFIGAPIEKYQADPKPLAVAAIGKEDEAAQETLASEGGNKYTATQETEGDGEDFFEDEIVDDEEEDGAGKIGGEGIEIEEEIEYPNDRISISHEEEAGQPSEDLYASKNEPRLATKEDLFPEDPLVEEQETSRDEPNSKKKGVAVHTDSKSIDSVDAEDVERGFSKQSQGVDLGTQPRKAEAQRQRQRQRRARAAETAASDWKFHILVGVIIVVLFGGGLAAVLGLLLGEDDDETS